MTSENLLNYLIVQKPIEFNNMLIYQTTLNEIFDYGIDKYNMLILPFLFDMDDIEIENKDEFKDVNIFDILLYNADTLQMLLNSISFFCKTEQIAFDEQKSALYIGDGYIDRNNFAEFANIILKINAKQKIKKEKMPKNMSAKKREVWEKIQAGRRRKAQKNQVELYDLLNICQFGGDYFISKDELLTWTLFNVSRCYNSITGKSAFRESFEIYCVTGESKLIENQHWTDLIKLDNYKEEKDI